MKLEGNKATVRPIAGTRKRGENTLEDSSLEQELLVSEKERAEHIMLVDLARNDLGRVCEYGSVVISEFMKVERYSHVMHIVSTVTGTLRDGVSGFDLIRACFPAGTVSGAPKVKAMEIIENLENVKREVYAGCIGYFSYGGNMDMCITIWTILLMGEKYFIQGGAGIVVDSIPEQEYQETLNKIEALREAIKLAEKGF